MNPLVQPIANEEHKYLKKEEIQKSQVNLAMKSFEKDIRESPNKKIREFNEIILHELSQNQPGRTPDTLEEFFFGDENNDYKMTDDSFDFSKEYVQKLIYALINPLEDSYETIRQIFYKFIFFGGIKTKDLPELIIHKGAKNINKLYHILGFQNKSGNKNIGCNFEIYSENLA